MQIADLAHARNRERQPVLDLPLRDVEQQALDDVADVFKIDRELNDLGPAPRLVRVERFPADLRQVALDRRIETIDLVILAPQRFDQRQVVGLQHRQQAGQHFVNRVGQADRLARRVAERERRCVERDRVQVLRLADHVGRSRRRQPALGNRGEALGELNERNRQHDVEQQMKLHDQLLRIVLQLQQIRRDER